MQKNSYSIKLWHKATGKYEDLGEFFTAESRGAAVQMFKDKTDWVTKPDTLLVALPPLCR